ncbi:putative Uncharacterized 50.6 kDa protein in the 5'region of gyrA and gyrB [Plantibacter sp. T3]|nr:putative Uncharacterized 50.6 kDa protein in the 5'region of gyrA and gyrB [Plantibacter sp. T3]
MTGPSRSHGPGRTTFLLTRGGRSLRADRTIAPSGASVSGVICVRQDRHQRLRPHRPQLLPRRPRQGQRPRDRRCQRPHRQQGARPPPEVRLHHGSSGRDGRARRRQDHRQRQAHHRARGARPRRPPLGRARRRHRHRVDRSLHEVRRRPQAHHRRRQEGPRLGSRHGQRRRHDRPRRQRGHLRRSDARHHLERVLHDELPRAARQGPARQLRHRAWPHDHGPRLHRRPEPAGRPAQRPPSCTRRRRQHHPDLHRCSQGTRPGHPGARRQARRLRPARPGPDRFDHRPHGRADQPGHGRGDQRRVQGCRRGPPQGHPEVHRGPDRLERHRDRPALLDLRRRPHQGHRLAGQGRLVVRQRVGLLEPPRRPHRVRRGPPLTNRLSAALLTRAARHRMVRTGVLNHLQGARSVSSVVVAQRRERPSS